MVKDTEDSRFTQIGKDPRYRRMRRDKRKVKIDKRFEGMFKNKNFQVKYTVDKRGRPVQLSSDDHLRKYYEMSDSQSDSDQSSQESEENENVMTKLSQKYENEKKKDLKAMKKTKNEKLTKDAHSSNKDSNIDFVSKKKSSAISKKEKQGKQKSEKEHERESEEESSDSEEEATSPSDSEGDKSDSEQGEEDQCDSAEARSGDESYKPDLARGEGNVESSDEEDEEEEDDGEEPASDDKEVDHGWGELDKDAPVAEEMTHRLALCNLDWDRIKAQDIMVLLTSFKPSGSIVKSVTVYPSEYGLQRMKEEDLKGPPELVETKISDSTSEELSDEKAREKMRQYQLNRLKYYYAVAEFDSTTTAEHVYDELNGMEYESSATRLDLRFIPNDMTFDQEPSSVATDVPDAAVYKPSQFFTTALCQSKVNLTWDETDKDRTALMSKKFSKEELEEMDVKDYLASDSDADNDDPYGGFVVEGGDALCEEETEEDSINKYRQLLVGIEEKEKDKEQKDTQMEISWEPGLGEKTEKLVKKKGNKAEKLTPWEQYLEKKKEKKKQKKQDGEAAGDEESAEQQVEAFSDDELPDDVDLSDPYFKEAFDSEFRPKPTEKRDAVKKKSVNKTKPADEELTEEDRKAREQLSLLMDDEEDKRQHFSLSAIMEQENSTKKKKKKKARRQQAEDAQNELQDNFKMDVGDSRFEAIYTSHLYNVDPSAPEYKKTKAMQAVIQEKQKRREKTAKRKTDSDSAEPNSKIVKDPALSSLVKSVKSKTEHIQRKKQKFK